MTFYSNKGSSYTSKRISNLIFVRSETTRFCRGEALCHTSRRYFSDSGNKILNRIKTIKIVCFNKIINLKEGSTKWFGEMLIHLCDSLEMIRDKLLIKLRKLRIKLLTLLKKSYRICILAPYRGIIRIIRKLFLSMRRLLKYRVPLGCILLVNLISIQVGLYTWMAFLKGETIQNFFYYYPTPDQDIPYAVYIDYLKKPIYEKLVRLPISLTIVLLYIYTAFR